MPRLTSEEPVGAALLGGALGDALGGLVEFDNIDQIRLQFGRGGIAEPPPGQPLLITDDFRRLAGPQSDERYPAR